MIEIGKSARLRAETNLSCPSIGLIERVESLSSSNNLR